MKIFVNNENNCVQCCRFVVPGRPVPGPSSQPQSWQPAWHGLHLRGQGDRRLLCWCRGRLSALPRLCTGLRVWGEMSRNYNYIILIISIIIQQNEFKVSLETILNHTIDLYQSTFLTNSSYLYLNFGKSTIKTASITIYVKNKNDLLEMSKLHV